MFRTTTFALALVAASLATAAFAETGTEAEQRACRHDVTRFCRSVMHETTQRVGQCLIMNAASISRGCQQVLRSHGQL
jgi:hypothetical protein